jgi:hypothetical protein
MHARARLLVLATAILTPALAHAQDASATSAAPVTSQAAPAAAAPTIDASAAAFRMATVSSDSASLMLQQRQSMGKPVALMIVGGAAVVLGAVIGDDVGTLFMIGGAVALLYGLYQYTK